MYRIDFEELRTGYNRIYDTDYRTVKSLLLGLYNDDPNVKKIAGTLGVSHVTLRSEMTRQGVKLLPKGHRGEPKALRDIRALGDVSEMTCDDIAFRVGFSSQYVGMLLNENKIAYLRRKYKVCRQ